jgi:hypothetical protein
MAFFSSQPRFCKQQFFSVNDVTKELEKFKLLYELNPATGSVNSCGDANKAANWRKYVRQEVINCAGTPVELDFFEKIAGGKTEYIPAKNMYFKQNCDFDRNIYAKSSSVAAGPGQPATFQLLKSNHSLDGTASYAVKGYELFIYEDQQWVRIMDVDDSTPYAHLVTVRPKNKNYTVNIRANKKMLVSPAEQVGGYTKNSNFAGEWQTPGYIYQMTMVRLRVQWKQLIDLMKGYEDVLQFGIMFDNEGKEIDCWEYYKKIKAQENLKYAFNLQFFMGQKVDNPDITVTMSDSTYPGFDGYMPQVKYGGGINYRYDQQYGIDPYADLGAILLRQDSKKKIKEFVGLRALPFQMSFDKNFAKVAGSDPGACTFDTFRRMFPNGATSADVARLGVKSINMWNLTIHWKDFDALSDSRSIGNADMPYHAFLMPAGKNLKDSGGRQVPPIEYFSNKGCALDGGYEEHDYDARKEKDGGEEVGGWMAKTIGMVVHCLDSHIIFSPRKRC